MTPSEPSLNTKKFVIIGAITLFLLYGIPPLIQALGLDQHNYSEETRAYAAEIESYSPAALQRLVASSEQPVMLHLFASWCPYCREQAPHIEAFINDNPTVPVRVVSVDRDKNELAEYLLAKPSLNYTPYRLNEADYDAYLTLLKEYGIDYKGSIPFTVLLSRDKKLVAQFRGVVDKTALEAALISEKEIE